MKNRTLNEIRQSKEFQQAINTKIYKVLDNPRSLQTKEVYNTEVDIDEAVCEIVENLNTNLFDIIFQAVNDEMHKYTVFQEDNYLTETGMEMFEEQWFEFYHEHHGEILGRIMKSLTK